MKRILISLLATTYATSLRERKLTKPGFSMWNGHLYKAVTFPEKTWQEAAAAAALLQKNGKKAHLATITSEEEGAFIETLRKKIAGEELTSFWVGGFKQMGDWKWVTDEDFESYTHWADGEPWDGPYITVGRFAYDKFKDGTHWNDQDCNYDIGGYIAEIDDYMVIEDIDVDINLIIGECDTGVVDVISLSECTKISDILNPCDGDFTCVVKNLNTLVKEGKITRDDKRAIQKCAALN
jgi:hypothetical protein